MQKENYLRAWRGKLGLSLQELGASSGCSPATIITIERYRHYPRPTTRERLAAALGVSEDALWPEDANARQ